MNIPTPLVVLIAILGLTLDFIHREDRNLIKSDHWSANSV